MRYLVWKLTWPEDGRYGFGPEPVAAQHGAQLEAGWVHPSVEAGEILGYLHGDIDLEALAAWQVRELTQAQALAFVKEIHAEAFMQDDGTLVVPNNLRRNQSLQ